jgi:chromosome segregation ATPase
LKNTEINRLVNTDFYNLFQQLQKTFIEQTKEDMAEELKKFDEKSELFQTEIDNLKKQVERLEGIDLEKHFNGLQKNLSDVFGAINSVSSTLTNVTQALQKIIQSLGDIQNSINDSQKEIKHFVEQCHSDIVRHLEMQDKELSALKDKMNFMEMQNNERRKEHRIILLTGCLSVFLILAVLCFIFFNLHK